MHTLNQLQMLLTHTAIHYAIWVNSKYSTDHMYCKVTDSRE